MGRTASTLEGAGTGAVLGSVAGPIGTAAGGLIGGAYGYLSSGGTDLPTTDANNFTFGTNQGSIAQPGYQLAQGYAGQGAAYRGAGAFDQRQADNALSTGDAAQMRGAGQISTNPNDRRAQLAALGGLNANAAQLEQMGTAAQGPSVAAAQLQQGQDAAMGQSLALARSGRSLGGGAAAMQQAQFQNAQTEQATNQQAAVARLQEQQQYRQMQLGALGAAQQGFGQAGQQANAINAANVGVQGQNIGFQQAQQGVNNQTTGVYGQIAQGLNSTGMQQNQLGLGYDQLGFNTLAASLGGSEQYQNSINGNGIAQAQINQAQNTQNMAMMSGAAGAAANYAASDRDVKQGIMPAGGLGDGMPSDPRMAAAAMHGTLGSSDPTNMAQYLAQQQQQRQVAAATPQQAGPNNPYAGMTSAGLTPQEQQMQLSAEQATPFDWQQHAANQQAMYSSGSGGQPPPAAAPPPQPAQQLGHGNTPANAAWGQSRQNAFTASDVNNKKDIKAADDEAANGSPLTSWSALARALGVTHAPPANPGAAVRDPNNPSQMISPYASIGSASSNAHGQPAGGGAAYTPQQIAAYQPPAQAAPPLFAPGTPPPSTWGGQAPPAPPAFTPQAPDIGGLDQAYAQQQAAPPGFQISDAHSKAAIHSLATQNETLRAALSGSGPTQAMLNQAAADQDAGSRIQYPQGGAGPSMAMLNQAAQDQNDPPVPPPDRPSIDLRPAAPYSYAYKDPAAHGAGRFYGPMAQDLEKTPAGASVVKRAPDGTKMVDTSRLSLVNTGAISDLQRQIAALGGGPALGRGPTPYPQLRQPGGNI